MISFSSAINTPFNKFSSYFLVTPNTVHSMDWYDVKNNNGNLTIKRVFCTSGKFGFTNHIWGAGHIVIDRLNKTVSGSNHNISLRSVIQLDETFHCTENVFTQTFHISVNIPFVGTYIKTDLINMINAAHDKRVIYLNKT